MSLSSLRGGLLCASALTLCSPLIAHAQESEGLETIFVTAQKRSEGLQDVPIAISAFTGEALQQRGIFSFNDIENITPSLEIEQAFGGGQPQIRLRGVGFDDYAANNTPTVGIYVDEVAYPIPAMTQGILFDMERLEVLRGPQGTLYGRNTTGGAVNFITNKPTDEFTGGIRGEFAKFERFQVEGFLSGAITENLKGRIAATTEQGGGWQFNRNTGEELGDANRFAVRGILEYETENLLARLTAHYYQDNSDGLGLYLLSPYTTNGSGTVAPDTSTRATGWNVSAPFAAETGLSVDDSPFRDNEGFGINLRVDYDAGLVTLTSITSYETLDRREFNDWDGTAVNAAEVLFNSQPDVFAQELRMTSNDDAFDGVNWIIGGYYSNEDLDELYQSDFQDSFGLTARTSYSQEAETAAIFGQVDVDVSERVTLRAGLRYENEDRQLIDITTVGLIPLDPPLVLPFVGPQDEETSMSEVSGKAGIDWRVNDDILAYASISRGVKSGGFTALNTLAPPQTEPFENEVLWAYEIGLKSELPDQNLRVNLAAFYYDYSNQQIQGFVVDEMFGAVGKVINVPEATIYGLEGELVWAPIEGLTIQQAVGWKKGEFDEFQDVDLANSDLTCPCAPAFIDRAGENLPFPEVSYSGSVSYRNEINEEWAYSVLFDWSYRDTLDKSRLGSDIFNVDDFWLVNARLGFGPSDGTWEIAGFVRNLTDSDFDETRNFFINDAVGNFVANGARGRPRTYGVSASFNF